ncbi:hypothetical protein Tco_1174191 [Tanacetum coccineum]
MLLFRCYLIFGGVTLHTDTVMSLSIDELSNEARAAKRLKSFLPEKAVAIKEAIKCHEAEIERHVTCIAPVKVKVDYELLALYKNVGAKMVKDGSAMGGKDTRTHEDVNHVF